MRVIVISHCFSYKLKLHSSSYLFNLSSETTHILQSFFLFIIYQVDNTCSQQIIKFNTIKVVKIVVDEVWEVHRCDKLTQSFIYILSETKDTNSRIGALNLNKSCIKFKFPFRRKLLTAMFYALYKILDVKSKRITVYWRYSSRVESLPARSCIVAEYHPSFFLINPYNILFQKEFTAVIVQQYFRLLAKTPWVTQCKSHTLHSQHSSGFTHLYS